MVPKEEIVKNGYDLSINKYKEVVYEKVEYPPTSEILTQINILQMEIQEDLKELEEMLGTDVLEGEFMEKKGTADNQQLSDENVSE